MDPKLEPLPDAPEGTCIALPTGAGVWAVRGRTGWFRCNSTRQTCECADFLADLRRGRVTTPCSHLRALNHWLRNGTVETRLTDAELRRLFA